MAIYHLSVKNISRGKGQSAVASAAYRSGEKLHDERLGQTFDYTRKERVEHIEILIPEGLPEVGRSELWNAVEASEKRHNSRVAREFEIAIPRELSADEQKKLVLEFTKELVDKHRVAADIAIHIDKGNNNPHAHIMLSTRRLNSGGFGEKAREFDDKVQGPKTVEMWRENWANIANEHLRKSNLEARIDHRSYKDRGLDKEPTRHMGPEIAGMEKRGIKTEIGEQNRQIIFINRLKERINQLSNSFKEKASVLLELSKEAIKDTGYSKGQSESSVSTCVRSCESKWGRVGKALEQLSGSHKESESGNKLSSGPKLDQATNQDRWAAAQAATAHLPCSAVVESDRAEITVKQQT